VYEAEAQKLHDMWGSEWATKYAPVKTPAPQYTCEELAQAAVTKAAAPAVARTSRATTPQSPKPTGGCVTSAVVGSSLPALTNGPEFVATSAAACAAIDTDACGDGDMTGSVFGNSLSDIERCAAALDTGDCAAPAEDQRPRPVFCDDEEEDDNVDDEKTGRCRPKSFWFKTVKPLFAYKKSTLVRRRILWSQACADNMMEKKNEKVRVFHIFHSNPQKLDLQFNQASNKTHGYKTKVLHESNRKS
jgi:hypothetical protein